MTTTATELIKPDISYQNILRIAVPVMFANMIMPLQGIIDTAIAGHFGYSYFVAGLGIAAQLLMLLLVSFNFLQYATSGQSAQIIGSTPIGAIRQQRLLTVLQQAIWLAILIGAMIWVLKPLLLPALLRLFSHDSQVITVAHTYVSLRIYGLPFELINYVCIGWFAGQGLSRMIVYQQLVIALTNIAISLWLVLAWHWQVAGLALGTVIGYIIGAVVALMLISRRLGLNLLQLWPTAQQRQQLTISHLLPLLRLNRDIFIRTLLLTLSFSWLTRLSASQGTVLLAANTLLLQVLSISAFALDGVAVATESLTGQSVSYSQAQANAEQNKPTIFQQMLWRTRLISALLALMISLGWWLGINSFIHLMTNVSNIQTASQDYQIFAVFLPLVGVWAYWLDGVFFGLTAGRYIRNAAMIVTAVFFISSFILVQQYGNWGIWLSLYVFLLGRGVVLALILAYTPLNRLSSLNKPSAKQAS